MFNWQKLLRYSFISLLAGLFVLSIGIRFVKLDSFRKIEADEVSWLLSGINLLQKGSPESWTVFWDLYSEYKWSYIGGPQQVVVNPYLDHPPVFQIFMGSWAIITGNASDDPFDWITLRVPMIVLAALTIIATSIFVYKVFSKEWATLTLVSFLTLPSHILSSRIIAAENFLVLLLVIALLLTYSYITNSTQQKKYSLINWEFSAIFLLSLIAPLVKLSGVLVPLTVGLLFIAYKKYRAAFWIGIAIAISFLLFILYGCYYDCGTFWSIFKAHGERPQTFWYFFTLFSTPDLGYYNLADPLFLVGCFGAFTALFTTFKNEKLEKNKIFLLAPWLVLVLVFVTIAPTTLYGWYKYLAIPFIAIGVGYVWKKLLEGQFSWLLLVIPAILVLLENVILGTEGFSLWRRIATAALVIPAIICIVKPNFVETVYYKYLIYVLLLICVVLQLLWSNTLLLNF